MAVTKTESVASGAALLEDKAVAFTKPGQKHVTPSPGAADRVFYETLLQQKPSSEMALVYCIEHGVLTLAALNDEGCYQKYLKVKSKKPGAPAPAPAAAPAPAKPKAKAAPKRKAIDESEDDAEEGVPDPAVPAPTKQKVKASPKRKVKEESPDDE